MPSSSNTEEFINKARKIYGYKYDYTLVEYRDSKSKVKIKFNGVVYEQTVNQHLGGKFVENGWVRVTLTDFLVKSKEIHGDKYDYSLVDYIDTKTKVKIKYNDVIYEQIPSHHMRGVCPERKTYKPSTSEFITKAKAVHGDKYDYSLTVYGKNNKTNVAIIYDGVIYYQTPLVHLKGGCPENISVKYTVSECVEKSKNVYGDMYDYTNSTYDDREFTFMCNGIEYQQNISTHLNGCLPLNMYKSKSKISKGESKIKSFLDNYNIIYQREKIFKECKNISALPFDFYIPSHNLLIEYDGEQHFGPVDFFGGVDKYREQLINDNIKNVFCENNTYGVKLWRISYLQYKDIYDILYEYFIKD